MISESYLERIKTMLDTKRFKSLVDAFYEQLLKTENTTTHIKLAEDKWSLAEIVGHLIDSASNNHQRFVRLQFGDLLDFPKYDGEAWIKAQNYNDMDWDTLIALWYNYNCLILHIIENIDKPMLNNVWANDETAITLEELIDSFYKHLETHIKHFNDRQKEL
jgi:hypothetical protein